MSEQSHKGFENATLVYVVVWIPFFLTRTDTPNINQQTWGLYVFIFTVAFAFLADHLVYANGIHSCRAAGLNEKPSAGDQWY